MTDTHEHTHEHRPPHGGKARISWVLIGFLAIAAFFLFSEHRAHALGMLPWLILLACPLLHVFMHGGHAKGDHRHD